MFERAARSIRSVQKRSLRPSNRLT